jgi:hypothetical protein
MDGSACRSRFSPRSSKVRTRGVRRTALPFTLEPSTACVGNPAGVCLQSPSSTVHSPRRASAVALLGALLRRRVMILSALPSDSTRFYPPAPSPWLNSCPCISHPLPAYAMRCAPDRHACHAQTSQELHRGARCPIVSLAAPHSRTASCLRARDIHPVERLPGCSCHSCWTLVYLIITLNIYSISFSRTPERAWVRWGVKVTCVRKTMVSPNQVRHVRCGAAGASRRMPGCD